MKWSKTIQTELHRHHSNRAECAGGGAIAALIHREKSDIIELGAALGLT